MIRGRYGRNLRSAVGSSAAPYGFTLAVWTTGAVLMHARGTPDVVDTLLFVVGVVLGFAAVGSLAFGSITGRSGEEQNKSALWGNFHLFSVGLSVGAAALMTYLVQSHLAWLVAAFFSAACYLLGLGAEFAVSERLEKEDGTG